MRTIYSEKGFSGNMLERIVDKITDNKDIWVAVMMAEEHQLTPVDRSHALRSAIISGGIGDHWLIDTFGALCASTRQHKHLGLDFNNSNCIICRRRL